MDLFQYKTSIHGSRAVLLLVPHGGLLTCRMSQIPVLRELSNVFDVWEILMSKNEALRNRFILPIYWVIKNTNTLNLGSWSEVQRSECLGTYTLLNMGFWSWNFEHPQVCGEFLGIKGRIQGNTNFFSPRVMMNFFFFACVSSFCSCEQWSPQKLMRLSVWHLLYFCRNSQMPHISQMSATWWGADLLRWALLIYTWSTPWWLTAVPHLDDWVCAWYLRHRCYT